MSLREVDMKMPYEEGLSLYECQNAVTHTLQQQGFVLGGVPIQTTSAGQQYYHGEMPVDLTSLNDDELGTLMGHLSMWKEYVGTKLAEARMNVRKAREELEFTKATVRQLFRIDPETQKKRPEKERDDFVLTDKNYVEANSRYIFAYSVAEYMEVIWESSENKWSSISRRITQRGQDIDRTNRSTGLASQPQGPMFARRSHP